MPLGTELINKAQTQMPYHTKWIQETLTTTLKSKSCFQGWCIGTLSRANFVQMGKDPRHVWCPYNESIKTGFVKIPFVKSFMWRWVSFNFKDKDSSWRNKIYEASFGARKTSKNHLPAPPLTVSVKWSITLPDRQLPLRSSWASTLEKSCFNLIFPT